MNSLKDRVIRRIDSLVDAFIVLIGAIILLVSVYSIMDNLWLYQNASDPSLLVYKPKIDDVEKNEKNSISLEGQTGWICIELTKIDYPVMQGESNFEFLNKNPYGEFSLSGSIFLDYRNNANFEDDYSMIYGHHMEHYAMFGALDLFTAESYYDSHRNGWLATKDGVYDLEVFAVCWGNGADSTLFSPQGRTAQEVLAYIEENAVFYSGYEQGNRIVALSTCAGPTDMSRLIVFCMLKDK